MHTRGSGILLHITSLPSPYGIGDLGPDAYRFVDFLSGTKQTYWQILPLTLTCPAYGNSPYSSFSALAGNTLLISPDRMIKNRIIDKSDIDGVPKFRDRRVQYDLVIEFKNRLFTRAFEKNRESLATHQDFQKFCDENAEWLDDYTLFITAKNHFGGKEWGTWPQEIRDRNPGALHALSKKLADPIMKEKFLQYIFFNQWTSLKNYCDSKSIKVVGDIPIYINYDSSDVWANPDIFSLDEAKKPLFVAGVPPDYFSSTGQLWGHPVYNWGTLKKTGYAWWMKRIASNLKLYHMFRLDHFRAFVGYWQVHCSEATAINGKWMNAPADDFFTKLFKHFPDISIIAEDLGVITPDVRDIIKKFGFPGMKVLLFAFGGDVATNPYAPHNHIQNCVVYTGTHDNNTITGWYKKELSADDRARLADYLGHPLSEKSVHWELVRVAMMSVSNIVIIPMQDLLGLGEKERMNLPASIEGNWEWRLVQDQLSPAISRKLSDLTVIYGRASDTPED